MGVSYHTCDRCSDNYPGNAPDALCETCGKCLCPDCVKALGTKHMLAAKDDRGTRESPYNEPEDISDCPFCEGEIVSERDAVLEEAAKVVEAIDAETLSQAWNDSNSGEWSVARNVFAKAIRSLKDKP